MCKPEMENLIISHLEMKLHTVGAREGEGRGKVSAGEKVRDDEGLADLSGSVDDHHLVGSS